jgi:SnoaL-like domain
MSLEDLENRLKAVEDELAIRKVILGYGPAADAGLSSLAASRWVEDGLYDWDADGAPHEGRAGIDAMLQTEGHLGLIGGGVAHFAGPPLIEIDGDTATALTYSLIMRRDSDNGSFYLWRVSAARWDLERIATSWLVRRRTNRLMDESGAGTGMIKTTLSSHFNGAGL